MDCMEARYPTSGQGTITCRKGHELPRRASVLAFKRNEPLQFSVCQECVDFNDADAPICPECGQERDDERVTNGMKCRFCAY